MKATTQTDDLTIPDFLRVENRPKKTGNGKPYDSGGKPPEPSPIEKIILSMSPEAQVLVRQRISGGRFRDHWLLEPGYKEDIEAEIFSHQLTIEHGKVKRQAVRFRFGDTITIEVLKKAPRAAGTKAAERYAEMAEWMKKHPGGTVESMMEATTYRKDDFHWDIEKGNIATKEIKL